MSVFAEDATGIALDSDASGSASASSTPPTSSPSPHPHPLPDSSQPQSQSGSESQSDASPAPARTPHAGLLIAAVLAPLALFLAAGFALYFYRNRNRSKDANDAKGLNATPGKDGAATIKRSRSFKGMHQGVFTI